MDAGHRRSDIVPMTGDDLDAVAEIERLSFRAPWPRQVFEEELTRPWAHVDLFKDRARGRVLAFCNYWVVEDEIHVLNLATHPGERRKGYAASLLDHLLDVARRQQVRVVTLEVRRSNLAALRLYRRFGFRPVGIRPGYYADDNEDAIVMVRQAL